MYEQFYNLNGRPFQLIPDPAFYFESRGHKRALAYLQYGVHQNEGFIVITGEIGAGKTTLVRSLIDNLDPSKVVAAQLVSTQLAAGDLLRAVALAFGIRCKGREKAHLLGAIEGFLTSLTIQSQRALLIVDEAQNLTPRAVEELRMLSNFQLGNRPLLQSFLVGQPQLRSIMQRPELEQLRQRVLASYHLGPLEEHETTSYIAHRLGRVGWNRDPELDAEALAAIHAITDGIPRKINLLCDRLLLSGFLANKHLLTASDVGAVSAELTSELGDAQSNLVAAASGESGSPSAELAAGHALRLAEISGRLDRIERTMSTAVQILRDQERRPDAIRVVK